jgi:hypothetical protein
VPRQWADKCEGRFGHGWDEQRRLTWQRQKELGVIPAGITLTPGGIWNCTPVPYVYGGTARKGEMPN